MSKKEENFNFENDEETDQITLILEDDSELLCDVVCIFDCNDREYVCLLPTDDPDGDFLFYRYNETEDGECDLGEIESDDEFEAVADRFEELLDEDDMQEFLDDLDDEA